ncbi:unnamed protein product [Cylindrotheca closterium]|uniref:Peptidase S1 domain-containing protein n=1 Tax=Cylindrotheca closterium TaxID=2856 RepID=A0AAD2G1E4_9STRA|nr:unnamed protein product [Cylindrotheca closterium]
MTSQSTMAPFCLLSMLFIASSDAAPLLFSDNDNSEVEGRIVGGTNAQPGEFPFFVQWTGCGASLIHEDIILTAAHCSPIDSEDVIVGAHSKYQTEGPPINSVERKIVERRIHENYDASAIINDFMVMKLDRAVDLPSVKLNKKADEPAYGDSVTVIGLGSTRGRRDTVFNTFQDEDEGEDEISTRNIKLQKVDIEIIPHSECNGNTMYNGLIKDDSMLCAGDRQGGKDACFGDSGAPLFEVENGAYKQIGVVSFGAGCARPDRPGVYARVSSAYDWIHEQICELADNPPSSCNPTGSPTPLPSLRPSKDPGVVSIAQVTDTLSPSSAPSRGFSSNAFDLIHFSFSEDELLDSIDGEVTQFVGVEEPTSSPTAATAVIAESPGEARAQGTPSSSPMSSGVWVGVFIPVLGTSLLLLLS